MSVMSQIFEKMKQYDTIIIHRHVRPDPDAYGSQSGLAEIIKASFSDKNVYVVGEEEASLSFLATMDDIKDELYSEALVIVCDTANQERISDQRFELAKEVIKIDHHPGVDAYGDVQWVDVDSSSTSEMIYHFYSEQKENGLKMTNRAAFLLYCGIVGDTGRFLFPSTTERTFQYASELVAYDFDRTEMYEEMYKTNLNIARLKGYILQNITVSEAGVSYVKLTKDILKQFNVEASETSSVVGVLGDIEDIKIWVIFVEEDDVIRVRLRSKGPVINQVAANYEGGGHPLASGAKIHQWETVDNVLADLEEVCKEK
ncbi:bifunctional oligoribonuclease/PAP phosphatase NrnA [Gracilibacillus salitolerans]|uniref:Bifunctional oligoribonuclease/PAP phosphatase NrnA n=1 Tax=Gracilibacillus salitolerans TaxID=2663022 RepID=A0A5Q2TMJ7_9BACI|nr:bifunctional oligoribonuclease/PAP phosphatase NrnA [Gracilibacillus salitolerans]QGH35307.1 bifunctional oligoribonuclease/PAP phosphatase NrnA [Gracilibacillus salitolerans]